MRLSHYLDVFYNKYYPPLLLNNLIAKRRNKNKSFSIICANCIGGLIYNQLGVKFQSPTINLTIYNPDFMLLLTDIQHYLSLQPQDSQHDVFEGNYPNAILQSANDEPVRMIFNHSATFEEGRQDWMRRAERLNLDQLYVIVFDWRLTAKDIENLGSVRCKKLVCFTAQKYPFPYCVHLPEFSEKDEHGTHVGNLLLKGLDGKRRIERVFDYVDWLNSDDCIAEHFRK